MSTQQQSTTQQELDHIYLNLPITYIGDANGLPASATPGNLYVALFVGAAEAAYGSYARQPIPRSASGFSRTGDVVTNVAQVNFPKSTSDGGTVTKVAIYDRVSGGVQRHLQTLANGIPTSVNCVPIIEAGTLTITKTP